MAGGHLTIFYTVTYAPQTLISRPLFRMISPPLDPPPLPASVFQQHFQEPENASQVSKQRGSIAKLVAWAAPSRGNSRDWDGAIRLASEDNAKTTSCVGVIRRYEF